MTSTPPDPGHRAGALKDRLFAPERLQVIPQPLADQQALRSTEPAGRLVALPTAAGEARDG